MKHMIKIKRSSIVDTQFVYYLTRQVFAISNTLPKATIAWRNSNECEKQKNKKRGKNGPGTRSDHYG